MGGDRFPPTWVVFAEKLHENFSFAACFAQAAEGLEETTQPLVMHSMVKLHRRGAVQRLHRVLEAIQLFVTGRQFMEGHTFAQRAPRYTWNPDILKKATAGPRLRYEDEKVIFAENGP